MKGETVELLERTRGVRLSAEEDDQLERIARDEGMTVSQLVRRTLRQSLFLPAGVRNPPVPLPTFPTNQSSTNELSPVGAQAPERGQLVELEGNANAEGVSPVDAADAALVPPAVESEGTRGE